ncbi:MAG: ATP-dependent protease ATPase subunit HslU [Candidatus Hydrothermales bacterium]
MIEVWEEEKTPFEIVEELNKYIIGQEEAKKAVAIALRNRWRRMRVKGKIKEEIHPFNILMIGPTGVGKTEIARRLAQLTGSPFLKVEATRYTEVGYVGRDVESMVRDLVDVAFNMLRQKKVKEVESKAKEIAENKIVEILSGFQYSSTEYIRENLRRGLYNEREIDIEVKQSPASVVPVMSIGHDTIAQNLQDIMEDLFPKRTVVKRMKVKDALEYLTNEAANKLINLDEIKQEAVRLAQEKGIIFIDEIDKIVGKGEEHGPSVSREGVQRDLLPIVEGTTVRTKYGVVKTDNILFIGAGAFSKSSPQDLIPELQGRFPIRVELHPLGEKEFERILVEPENSLVKQFKALFEAEGYTLEFEPEAIKKIAHYAYLANQKMEDIGARRLQTVMNLVLEEALFRMPYLDRNPYVIDAEYVDKVLSKILKEEDVSKYIL